MIEKRLIAIYHKDNVTKDFFAQYECILPQDIKVAYTILSWSMNKPHDIIMQSAAIICSDNHNKVPSIFPSFRRRIQLNINPVSWLDALASLALFLRPHGRFVEFISARLQAEEQQQRRHCEAIQDEEDKKAEIYNHVTGDFLTEAREQAESTRGPYRPLPDRYKGMTANELKVFRDAQLEQMEEIRVSMRGKKSNLLSY